MHLLVRHKEGEGRLGLGEACGAPNEACTSFSTQPMGSGEHMHTLMINHPSINEELGGGGQCAGS